MKNSLGKYDFLQNKTTSTNTSLQLCDLLCNYKKSISITDELILKSLNLQNDKYIRILLMNSLYPQDWAIDRLRCLQKPLVLNEQFSECEIKYLSQKYILKYIQINYGDKHASIAQRLSVQYLIDLQKYVNNDQAFVHLAKEIKHLNNLLLTIGSKNDTLIIGNLSIGGLYANLLEQYGYDVFYTKISSSKFLDVNNYFSFIILGKYIQRQLINGKKIVIVDATKQFDSLPRSMVGLINLLDIYNGCHTNKALFKNGLYDFVGLKSCIPKLEYQIIDMKYRGKQGLFKKTKLDTNAMIYVVQASFPLGLWEKKRLKIKDPHSLKGYFDDGVFYTIQDDGTQIFIDFSMITTNIILKK